MDKRNANNTIEHDAFVLVMQHGLHLCTWIIDSDASKKHMIVYEVAFNTYEVIASDNVYLGDDSVK